MKIAIYRKKYHHKNKKNVKIEKKVTKYEKIKFFDENIKKRWKIKKKDEN